MDWQGKLIFNGCRTRGYTIAEIILTTIIIGVLAAIALPRFGGGSLLNEKRVDSAAGRLAVDLRYTRQLAVTNGKNYYLSINQPQKQYAIFSSPTKIPASQVDETRLINSIIIITGEADFAFGPKGNLVSAGGNTCTLQIPKYSRTVTIIRPTGRIKW